MTRRKGHLDSPGVKRRHPAEMGFRKSSPLLNGAANLRKDVVGIGSDEADRAHDNDENYSQHDCIFGNVLAVLIFPELL